MIWNAWAGAAWKLEVLLPKLRGAPRENANYREPALFSLAWSSTALWLPKYHALEQHRNHNKTIYIHMHVLK